MSEILTMAQTAGAVGLSYERFRKVWPQMVRADGFPRPFHGRRWEAEAVHQWRADRSWRPLADLARRAAAHRPSAAGARAALEALRSGR